MLIDYIKSLPKDGFLELEKEVELWISYKKQGMIEARQKLIEHCLLYTSPSPRDS